MRITCITIIMVLYVTACDAQSCQKNFTSQLKCVPVNNQVCLSSDALDGSNMTWIESSKRCSDDNGRLPWLGQDISLDRLESTLTKHSDRENYTAIRIGLLYNGHNHLFWQNEMNETDTCTPKSSSICSLDVNSTQCSTLGCCSNGSHCLYPGSSSVVTYTINTTIDTSEIRSENHTSCVGLKKAANDTWFWKAYNCTEKPKQSTAYFCEYKCGKNWPAEQSSTHQLHTTTSQTHHNTTTSGTHHNMTASGTYHNMTTSGTHHKMTTSGTKGTSDGNTRETAGALGGSTESVTSNKTQNNSAVRMFRIHDTVQMVLMFSVLIILTSADCDF